MKEIKEPETLWEKEQMENKQKENLLFKQRLLGRENVPAKMVGVILKTQGVPPEKILWKGCYIKLENNSWIKKFDVKYRYHAYILPDNNIQIHTDFKKRNGNHVASCYLGREEKKRLREFIVREKIEHPSKKQIDRVGRKFYKKNILSKELLLKALREIKNEIHQPDTGLV